MKNAHPILQKFEVTILRAVELLKTHPNPFFLSFYKHGLTKRSAVRRVVALIPG